MRLHNLILIGLSLKLDYYTLPDLFLLQISSKRQRKQKWCMVKFTTKDRDSKVGGSGKYTRECVLLLRPNHFRQPSNVSRLAFKYCSKPQFEIDSFSSFIEIIFKFTVFYFSLVFKINVFVCVFHSLARR